MFLVINIAFNRASLFCYAPCSSPLHYSRTMTCSLSHIRIEIFTNFMSNRWHYSISFQVWLRKYQFKLANEAKICIPLSLKFRGNCVPGFEKISSLSSRPPLVICISDRQLLFVSENAGIKWKNVSGVTPRSCKKSVWMVEKCKHEILNFKNI